MAQIPVNTRAVGDPKGDYLLYRHRVINDFLCVLNGTKDELEQTEKIEHFLGETTVRNMEKLTDRLKSKSPPL